MGRSKQFQDCVCVVWRRKARDDLHGGNGRVPCRRFCSCCREVRSRGRRYTGSSVSCIACTRTVSHQFPVLPIEKLSNPCANKLCLEYCRAARKPPETKHPRPRPSSQTTHPNRNQEGRSLTATAIRFRGGLFSPSASLSVMMVVRPACECACSWEGR